MQEPLDNPLRHFSEAAHAARSYLEARKEHLFIAAEQLAVREAKRAAWGAVGLIFANLALILTFGWLTYSVHELGVAPGWIALGCLVFFGGIAAFCTWFSQREHATLSTLAPRETHPSRRTAYDGDRSRAA